METLKPASVAWSEVAPGTVPLAITFTSATRDLTLATSGRVFYTNAAGVRVFWAMTVSGTPTARSATMVHMFTTGDLTEAMVTDGLHLHGLCTINGVEYPDMAEPFWLPVVMA